MGAWAEDTFGNDTVCDWIGMFLENSGLPTVKFAWDEGGRNNATPSKMLTFLGLIIL
ncbi:MAG: hypothetical protein AAFN42_13585 [Cyanobacteria bacterium J06554_1]